MDWHDRYKHYQSTLLDANLLQMNGEQNKQKNSMNPLAVTNESIVHVGVHSNADLAVAYRLQHY